MACSIPAKALPMLMCAVTVLVALVFVDPGVSHRAALSLTKTELQRRANAICRTHTQRIQALGVTSTPSRAVVERWASILKTQERQLAALKPPLMFAARYRKMLAAGRAIPPLILDWDAAQRAGDLTQAERLRKRAENFADTRSQLARAMRLTACAAQ
jgi:hypothetical protein